ncbi:hypothetical protein P152DRAFT_453113 [Eremomyces bilateralis CBS 781.70]|uniref:Uncharacterized protein n=1 Tax=Eremomyces bilateralis CBS 781.70 TaxID=1392243 RepID=A0A6G1FQX7_9PEZI|nr:uncharacterized protein P152DRAFT_453113 [Eremomyces bilateralis CBS 781.70]KAF1808173.1 hypothetical protein P152DRAFT_453113 [Eremomyces bilateralis CBS 781.70]
MSASSSARSPVDVECSSVPLHDRFDGGHFEDATFDVHGITRLPVDVVIPGELEGFIPSDCVEKPGLAGPPSSRCRVERYPPPPSAATFAGRLLVPMVRPHLIAP